MPSDETEPYPSRLTDAEKKALTESYPSRLTDAEKRALELKILAREPVEPLTDDEKISRLQIAARLAHMGEWPDDSLLFPLSPEDAASMGGDPADDGPALPDSAAVRAALPLNEAGDAILYRALYTGRFLFDHTAGLWLRWAGHHWEIDRTGEALAAVEGVAALYDTERRKIEAETGTSDPDEMPTAAGRAVKKLRKRADRARSMAGRRNILSIAATDGLGIDGADLDARPWLLPCSNCVVDLKTGEARPGRPEDHLLRATPTEWRGIDEPCPQWERFQYEIHDGDQELIDFKQRFEGHTLVGEVRENKIGLLSGARGREGKSTEMGALDHCLGDLAGPIRSEMLLDTGYVKNSAAPSPDIMALRGKRLVHASETDERNKFSEGRVKFLTGGDEITARNPHDRFEQRFKPSHSLFLLTNHLPSVSADDTAFWARCIVIPYNLSFVESPVAPHERKADLDLAEKLRAEASGILAWLVRGCLVWQSAGLNPPEVVRAAVASYRADEDLLGDFADECLDADPEALAGVPTAELYNIFESWWTANVSKHPPKQRRFSKLLRRRFRCEKDGVYKFYGLRIKPEALNLGGGLP